MQPIRIYNIYLSAEHPTITAHVSHWYTHSTQNEGIGFQCW